MGGCLSGGGGSEGGSRGFVLGGWCRGGGMGGEVWDRCLRGGGVGGGGGREGKVNIKREGMDGEENKRVEG